MLRVGAPMGPNVLVTIRGRTTGIPRTTPLAIIEKDGRRWIWSPFGEVDWVRNLRAAGRATITVRGIDEEVMSEELAADEHIAFFDDVLVSVARSTPFGMRFIRSVLRVDLSDPIAAADGRPVFEIRPA
jgi:deazaflavin-dependent oxidoreductase (nitroreductase family)